MTDGPLGIILAGGESRRMGGLPKPLVKIGGTPLLLRVAAQLVRGGARRIVALTGGNDDAVRAGLGLDEEEGEVRLPGGGGVRLELRQSGRKAGTGGRLLALSPEEIGAAALLSYTDILTDFDPGLLLSARAGAGAALALLAVHPTRPWGEIELSGDRVTRFEEKTRDTGRWINGGIFAIDGRVRAAVRDPAEMLENGPLSRLLALGAVIAVRHQGDWTAIDTPKDAEEAARQDRPPVPGTA